MIYVQDKRLKLPDGRTLAYADNGNTSSTTVVLFLHGPFQVGNASRIPPILQRKNAHIVAPSLPGWGESSPIPQPSCYATTFAADMSLLLSHLHSPEAKLSLYIVGHSLGCISAQMLYGASHDIFVFGRHISGLILLAPHSPPHCHEEYHHFLSWSGYFLAGPPSRFFPFSLFRYLAKLALMRHLKDETSAEAFIRGFLLSGMDGAEKDVFEHWRTANGFDEDGQFERECGANALRSVARTWRGFLDISAIYHSGWGDFCPQTLDEEHTRPRVIVVAARRDHVSPKEMGEWIANSYKNACLKQVEGGQLSVLFHMDEILEALLEGTE